MLVLKKPRFGDETILFNFQKVRKTKKKLRRMDETLHSKKNRQPFKFMCVVRRVTRCVRERNGQNVAQRIFGQHLCMTFIMERSGPKNSCIL
jgi:hypothetical protein